MTQEFLSSKELTYQLYLQILEHSQGCLARSAFIEDAHRGRELVDARPLNSSWNEMHSQCSDYRLNLRFEQLALARSLRYIFFAEASFIGEEVLGPLMRPFDVKKEGA